MTGNPTPDALTRQQFTDAIVRALAADPDGSGWGWHLVGMRIDSEFMAELTFETYKPFVGYGLEGMPLVGRRTVAVTVVAVEEGSNAKQ